jgi:hypothetical protein
MPRPYQLLSTPPLFESLGDRIWSHIGNAVSLQSTLYCNNVAINITKQSNLASHVFDIYLNSLINSIFLGIKAWLDTAIVLSHFQCRHIDAVKSSKLWHQCFQ